MATTLQLEENLEFQRQQTHVQRVGSAALCVLIVAALAGLFGHGPLTAAKAESGGVTLEYDRFMTMTAESSLRLRAPAAEASEVRLTGDFLEAVVVETLTPQPRAMRSEAGVLVLEFDAKEELVLLLRYRAESAGRIRGGVRTASGRQLEFWQVYFP